MGGADIDVDVGEGSLRLVPRSLTPPEESSTSFNNAISSRSSQELISRSPVAGIGDPDERPGDLIDGTDSGMNTPKEDSPPLTLPQPLPPPSFIPSAIRPMLLPWADQIRDLTTLPRKYLIRGVKSGILALKVSHTHETTIYVQLQSKTH